MDEILFENSIMGLVSEIVLMLGGDDQFIRPYTKAQNQAGSQAAKA
jgi:hypothetical protein